MQDMDIESKKNTVDKDRNQSRIVNSRDDDDSKWTSADSHKYNLKSTVTVACDPGSQPE